MPVRARISETLERANLPLLASALAFDAMLAVIPLAVLVVSGLGALLSSTRIGAVDPATLVVRFLPEHIHGGANDPFALIEHLITEIENYRTRVTWIAVPLFLWLSTRVFAAIRLCLSQIFQVRQRPVRGHFVWSYVAGYLIAKAQDLAIVFVVLVLALASLLTTAALAVIAAQGVTLDPRFMFLLTAGGRIAGQGVAFLFGVALFILLYRYASPKRLAWGGAIIASAVGTLGFEIAKRLYGIYLHKVANAGQYSVDVNIGAVLLFILWLWYMSLVFLIGAAVADVWDHVRNARRVERVAVSA